MGRRGVMIEMTGQRHGRLTVLALANRGKSGSYRWTCKCDCGRIKEVDGYLLRSGNTTSCGCYHSEVVRARLLANQPHGMFRTPTWNSWKNMKERCTSPACKAWRNYGGRGIQMDPSWMSFEVFLKDMGLRPEGRTLGRIDNDGPYTKENCRWETWDEQSNNKRCNRYIEHDGRRQTMTQWARELGIRREVMFSRLQRGWSHERAVTTPLLSPKERK